MNGTQVQWRRGDTAQNAAFKGVVGEITVDTTRHILIVHDNVMYGGYPQAPYFVRGVYETGGSTELTIGAIADGKYLKRVGSTIVGADGGGGGDPSGSAGGDLAGTYPNPTVSATRGLRETTGPTVLTIGNISDGQYLKRVGSTIVSAAVSGGGGGNSYFPGGWA